MSEPESHEESLLANLREFYSMFGADVCETIIQKYLDSSAQLIEKMQQSLAEPGSLKAAAHSLKGASLNMGAHSLAHTCAALERQLEDGVSPRDLIANVRSCFADVRHQLEAFQRSSPEQEE